MDSLNIRETSALGFMVSGRLSNSISVAKAGVIAPATSLINVTN